MVLFISCVLTNIWFTESYFHTVSLFLLHAVYVFAKTYKRDQEKKNAQTAAAAAAVVALSSPAAPAAETVDPTPPTPPPKRVLPPIPEDEQRQVYKWMLEEKRKIKPRNAAEKNKINEEKALLKEFIRAESLPRL
jgi:zona occludens toxin (predicted ATPase)